MLLLLLLNLFDMGMTTQCDDAMEREKVDTYRPHRGGT